MIYTGRGMGDNLRALAAGEVDVAIATPASFAAFAQRGVGPFEGNPLSNLVAIAALPHWDAMVPVARRELGLHSLADVATFEGPLRVSLGANDPDGFMGLAGDILLGVAGVSEVDIIARGGKVTRHEQPFDVIADLHEGRADLMISEAIMTSDWQALARGDVEFLTLTPEQIDALDAQWGLRTRDIPAGYFAGTSPAIRALDYSDWLIATTTALPDDVAELLARAVVDDSEYLARTYRHLPVEYSPLHYPIDYRLARETALPLHPAVARVYDSADAQTAAGQNTAPQHAAEQNDEAREVA
ncbi:MAG: TAXI family TRAP transporter solute-binding subunit [Microbacterium sp.]